MMSTARRDSDTQRLNPLGHIVRCSLFRSWSTFGVCQFWLPVRQVPTSSAPRAPDAGE